MPVVVPDRSVPTVFSSTYLNHTEVIAEPNTPNDEWTLVNGNSENFSTPGTVPEPGDIFRGIVQENAGFINHAGIVKSYDAATNTVTLIDNWPVHIGDTTEENPVTIGETNFYLGPPQSSVQGGTRWIIEGYSTFYSPNTTSAPSEPIVTGVSPTPVPGSNSPQTIEVLGSNFVTGDTLLFTFPDKTTGPNLSPVSVATSSEIDYTQFNDKSGAGAWQVQVKSPDGTLSNAVPFTVSAAPGTNLQGIDGLSANRLSPAQITGAGKGFVIRYIGGPDPVQAKYFDIPEAQALVGAGLDVVSCFERHILYDSNSQPIDPAPTVISYFTPGQADADAQAAILGTSTAGQIGGAIYFACDMQPATADIGLVDQYFQELQSYFSTNNVPFQIGVYGPGNVLSSLGLSYSWLADAWSNNGYTSQRIEQTQTSGSTIGSVAVDLDASYTQDFGQWSSVACFAAGTRILTASGEVSVEALSEGYLVPTVLGGGPRRIKWIGHRRIDCRRHPKPRNVWPVRVCPDAFGLGMPHRDLFLSPDHAVFIDGVLIPIKYLINGKTVVQEPRDTVRYFHIELAQHDILSAEGLPCESFLDTGNRADFDNGGPVMRMHPEFALRVWEADGCAPLVIYGAELEAARSFLLDRAAQLGHAATHDPDLRLIVAGRELRPETRGRIRRFHLPRAASGIRLVSRSAVPAEVRDDSTDHRQLGVAVSRMIYGGKAIPLTDPRLSSGWHDVEHGSDDVVWRWTDGDAALALPGGKVLDIEVAITERYWLDSDSSEGRKAQPRKTAR
jgi:hypothetical protein